MPQTPEQIWPVDADFAESYQNKVTLGSATARNDDAVIVAIARNSMPYLANTLELIDKLQKKFRSCRLYVYENDSDDDTARVLDAYAATRGWVTVEHDVLGESDGRGFERERTERLSRCRAGCQEWVRENAPTSAWTIVLDTDPHLGFSVDGVMNSIGWLLSLQGQSVVTRPGGMASHSLYYVKGSAACYDSWAARLNWWDDRREVMGFGWFSLLMAPVGSPPIPMNSAFGGLCVYDTKAFLSGRYSGDDCEHVGLHRTMRLAGYQLYLNPGCRYVAIFEE